MLSRLTNALMTAVICIVVLTGATAAQERATILATATVVSSLTVVGSNNLQFGTVTPGVNKAVDKATLGFAGEWTISGTNLSELSIQFSLPDSLLTTDSLSRMRVSFASSDASYGSLPAHQSAPVGVVDPNGPSAYRLGANGQMLIWIGGTVFPRISQTGGDYSAEILLTVAYTGS